MTDTPPSGVAGEIADCIVDGFRRATEGFVTVAEAVGERAGAVAGRQAAADAVLFATRFGAVGAGYAFEQDAAYPMLEKFLTYTSRGHGIGNADCAYHQAALDGAHAYRLFGNRGTARLIDIEVSSHTIADAKQSFSDSAAAKGIELPVGEDFEIVLSREQPASGLWLKLPEGPCFVIIRQYFYDWDREIPAEMMIERIGADYPPPPVDPATLMARSRIFARWINSEYLVPNRMKLLNQAPNELKAVSFPQAFLQSNHYMAGHLVCGDDEASIIELPAPEAKYWSIGVFDALGGAMQPHLRQVSLNGHQATVDADGMFRAVVAHRDPGYANWLDTAGHNLMLTMVRMNGARQPPEAATTRVVPFADLARHLPADSRRVTVEDRQAMLRARLVSAYRRRMVDC